MKIIALILSLCILALSAIPCIDAKADLSGHQVEIAQPCKDTHQHNEADNCSPFCTCNCCTTSVILQEYMAESVCFSFSGKKYFPVSDNCHSNLLASIWQPPKMS